MIDLFNVNTAELDEEFRCRARILRQHRDSLAPALAAELAELERAGY